MSGPSHLIRRRIAILAAVSLFAISWFTVGSLGAEESILTKQAAEIFAQIRVAVDIAALKTDVFKIGDITLIDSGVVSTKLLVFSKNSKLLFTDSSLRSSPLYILADHIVVDGDATISWTRRDVTEIPPERSSGRDGAMGRGDGADGADGAVGDPGNIGYPGRSAPSIFIFTRAIDGGKLRIDLAGEKGGTGGKGQDGGRGGDGARGASASQSLFDCKRGPGAGGHGGNGGAGGLGGVGGDGGAGGDLVVAGLPQDKLSTLEFAASGGDGGDPGVPGHGGDPGAGGSEGEPQLPYCRPSGRGGAPGDRGAEGPSAGTKGRQGPAGNLISVQLPDRILPTIFDRE